MQVVKRYNQNRRDLTIDMECEGCGNTETDHSAYDDSNFWENVIPDKHCSSCGKSSNDMGNAPTSIHTKYPAGMEI